MRRITLVCTTHTAIGLCDENELVKILQAIGPEVIFEELRPTDFDSLYSDKSKHTLEMRAITAYLRIGTARQVPVDEYEQLVGSRDAMRTLNRLVESRCREYCDVMDQIQQMQFEFGFAYLNSPTFVAHIKRSERLFEETVLKYGDGESKELHARFREQLHYRDSSMLRNIYEFCRKNDFMEGVFLVGAGHMTSIIEGIQNRMAQEAGIVEWRFWNQP